MASTVDQSARKFLERFKRIALIPDQAVETAHKIIMAEVPVYTRTYQQAINIWAAKPQGKQDMTMARVFVSEATLMNAAADRAGAIALLAIPGVGVSEPVRPDEYITGEPRFIHPEADMYVLDAGSQPYPIRIEAQGSPKSGMGQGMWAQAAQAAGNVVHQSMREAVV